MKDLQRQIRRKQVDSLKQASLQDYLGHAATKPDKVNIYKWEADYEVAVKLTSMTDDVLKSNNVLMAY